MTSHTATDAPGNPLDVLTSDGPHSSLGEGAMAFGQFVGDWDMDVRFYDQGGGISYQQTGSWSFAWVLDGRAVQDILIYPELHGEPSFEPGRRRVGTTLRHYDPEADRWRVAWLGATSGILVFLTGGRDGSTLVLDGREDTGDLLRWTFTDITPTSFLWTGWISHDDGATWRIEQQMNARRQVGRRSEI